MGKAIILLFIITLGGFCYGQEVQIKTRLDTNKIQIGEQVKFTLEVLSGKSDSVILPIFKDSIGSMEILSRSKMFSEDRGGLILKKQEITLTKFDTGLFMLPPLRIEINGEGSYSKPQMVKVVEMPLDTIQKGFYGIKAIMEEPYTLLEIVPYILLIVLILGIVIYIVHWWYKRNQSRKPMEKIKVVPAHIQAMEALQLLDKKELWQKGKIKKYYSELTDILRGYFEKRFGVTAMECTSQEILDSIDKSEFSKENYQCLEQLLFEADMVKFAKARPDEHLHDRYRKYVEGIVVQTKIKEE